MKSLMATLFTILSELVAKLDSVYAEYLIIERLEARYWPAVVAVWCDADLQQSR